MRATLFLLALFIFSFAFTATAMPPHPDLADDVRSGDTAQPYYLEHRMDLNERGINTPNQVQLNGAARELDEIIFNSIVLLVDFNDNTGAVQAAFFDNLMYGTGTGTVADFYDEVSYGEFTLTSQDMPSTTGWFRMPHNYTYYVDGQNGFGDYPNNAQGLVEDAVIAADPYIDFSIYDYDGDDFIDGLFVVHSGPGAEWTGDNDDIWSHKWQTASPVPVDGVFASVYAMQPEFWSSPGDMTIGVFAHEMGHAVFGLPDLYDYDYDSAGLSDWSLMAGGSWNGASGASPAHPDAWSRIQMGFVDPVNIMTNRYTELIPPVQNEPVIYRLWTNGNGGPQYFLVENRQYIGYDNALPGVGVLIYHVDENVTTGNNNQWYPGYTNNGHYLVALEQADGLWELEQDSWADGGDPYPGNTLNTSFDQFSTPSSNDYFDNPTDVAVTNIGWGPMHTADLIVGVESLVTISLVPDASPVTVPAGGGTFEFDVHITNSLMNAQSGQAWTEAVLPNGNVHHILTRNLNFQPGTSLDISGLTQEIPAFAPAGQYVFRANLGLYPNFVAASDEFGFTKTANTLADGGPVSSANREGSWLLTGLPEQQIDEDLPLLGQTSETPDLPANKSRTNRATVSSAGTELPDKFELGKVFPNPFNEQATVQVALPETMNLTVALYDILGRQVMTLSSGRTGAGTHRYTIDAANLASGVYFLRAEAGSLSATQKVALVR